MESFGREKREIRSNKSKSNDTSGSIAEKLLQGWALLAEHCPLCLTPLLRDREKRIYCVSCSQWVVREEDIVTEVPQKSVQCRKSLAETASTNGSVNTSENCNHELANGATIECLNQGNAHVWQGDTTKLTESDPTFESTKAEPPLKHMPMLVPHTAFDRARNEFGGHSDESYGKLASVKVEMPTDTARVLSETLAILVKKIEVVSHLIRNTDDPKFINQLLETLEHCIQVADKVTTFAAKISRGS
eukprot:TRINITY_DN1019_c0_g1_i1.p1 TRINITY_DN1019_c0_g1~~TRINITY_DN1019_c0_g1_i1.p1  ORF type:complete len:246 (+),score=46.96 TRINITY_DN1019_c0_g1_i1:180-917(+)